MRTNIKMLLASSFVVIIVFILAIFFSILLGKAYLGILKSSKVKAKPNPHSSTLVTAEKPTERVELMPVSVFFLQGGVYSELDSARKAAEDFFEIGLDPFITKEAPYRLYIGFFGSRDEAVKLKKYISEKELSTFIQSKVLNAKVLVYAKSNTQEVEKWIPYLDQYSSWLNNFQNSCSFGAFEHADKNQLTEALPALINELININMKLEEELSKQEESGRSVKELATAAVIAEKRLKELQTDWNETNFNMVSKGLISFLKSYIECWQSLGNTGKT